MRIFVSYRRGESGHLTARIVDRLRRQPEVEKVFFDIDEVRVGENFETRIAEALGECSLFVAVIGRDWCGETGDGTPARIFGPKDYVRREVRAALQSRMKTVPVLADGAAIPDDREVPDDVQPLLKHNAFTVGFNSFERDVTALIDGLLRRRKGVADAGRSRWIAPALRSLAGVFVAALALVIAASIHQRVTGGSPLEYTFGRGLVWLMIVGSVALGALTPHALVRWRRKGRAPGFRS